MARADRLAARFASAADAPGAARRRLDAWLPDSVPEADRAALRLLVSELVTNGVRHSGTSDVPVELAAELRGRTVRIEVRDGGPGFEPGRPEPRGADGGYGLFLVERMTTRWGVEAARGTAVWFELELPATPA